MVKRFVEDVQLGGVDVSTGAAQGILSLTQKLEAFKRQVEQTQTVIGEKKGREEAEGFEFERDPISGQTKAPEKRKTTLGDILLTGGSRTAAFNKTLRDGYLASLENDLRLDISKIEQENPDNINVFNDKIDGLRSGTLKSVDPSARQAVQDFLDNKITNSRIRIQAKTIERQRTEANVSRRTAIESAGNEAARLSREGDKVGAANALQDLFASVDGMVETGDLTTEKAAKFKRDAEKEATEQGFRFQLDALADSEGFDAAFEDLEAIRNKVPQGWTPDEWDAFVASAQADINGKRARQAKANAELSLETSREISNLKIQAKTGTGQPSEIIKKTEDLFNTGQITESERTSIITAVINAQKETDKVAASKQKVANRLSGNAEVIVNQNDVDIAWEEDYAPAVDQLPAEQKIAVTAQFVDDTKRIPKQVKQQVISNLNSLDPDLVVEAASLMDRLDNVRGIPEHNFSSNERAFAEIVVLLQKNLDPKEALDLARKNTDPNDRARVEMRAKIIKDEEFEDDYRDEVNDAFDPFFGFTRVDPINEGKLVREYKVLFEEHFKAGMSKDAADRKAKEILKRNWGETSTTGKTRAIKYPPEDYYTVAGNSEYMGKQLLADVRKGFFFDREIDSDMIRVVSDQETARTATQGSPSYMIILDLGEDGLSPLVGFRWKPDMQAEVERQTASQEERLRNLREAP